MCPAIRLTAGMATTRRGDAPVFEPLEPVAGRRPCFCCAACRRVTAPDLRRAGGDPVQRRDPVPLGRRCLGRGERLDLRLDGSDPHARVRAAARRQMPPLGYASNRLRGRCHLFRPRRNARPRKPRDRRGQGGRSRRGGAVPPGYLASHLLARARPAPRARVLRAAPSTGTSRKYAQTRPLSNGSGTRTTSCWGSGRSSGPSRRFTTVRPPTSSGAGTATHWSASPSAPST